MVGEIDDSGSMNEWSTNFTTEISGFHSFLAVFDLWNLFQLKGIDIVIKKARVYKCSDG